MNKLLSLLIPLLLFALPVQSQKNITIKGTALNGDGRKVELLRVADQISKREVILDTFRIGEDR